MSIIRTEKYKYKEFYENLYSNFDKITTQSLSNTGVLFSGNYRFLTSDRPDLYGIRYIIYNSGKEILLPVIEGTLYQECGVKNRIIKSFVINNRIDCPLMIIPVKFIVTMQSNTEYIISLNELGDVINVRNVTENDYNEIGGDWIYNNQ